MALAHVDALDLKGWRYELAELRRSELDRGWVAVFDTFSPAGSLVDGPVAFSVNESGITPLS